MNLILVTALLAVCGADKLDRTYLPPTSASTAGGSPGSLDLPFKTFNQGLGSLPKGGYSNDFEGVVVDAAAPGTRASGADGTGLGGPRIAYGSTNSKVGEAAFTADTAFPRVGANSGFNTQGSFNAQPQNQESGPERIQSFRDRVSNTVRYENDVSPDRFNYAFETDNGIVAEENGIEVNGVKAQGGYSYTGDDGQVYSVSYTADEEGYRPKGDHLPTPPPIPAEILESLKKNAQDEAAGIIDDGSYDARKYNTEEAYIKSDTRLYNNGQPNQHGNRPDSDAIASGSFNNQYNQGFVQPNSQKFGSNLSLGASTNIPSNGNNYGTTNGISPIKNAQSFGFGISLNNEYPLPSIYNSNRIPAIIGSQGTQNNAQSEFPTIPTSSTGNKQNTEVSAFIPLAQQNLQDDRSKRPYTPIFGKPTVIDSTLSIKDPFAKRPPSNRFPQNNQQNPKPSAIGGSFEIVSGNVYSSKNEYLPPRRQNNKPNQNIGNQRFQGTNSGTQPTQQFQNSQISSFNSPSTSAFASVSRPSLGFVSSQGNNGQQSPHYTGNNLQNQIVQTSNSRPLNQEQALLSPSPPKVPNFNRSPVSQFQYRPSTFAPQSPTLQPQAEVATTLKSNSGQNKDATPIPVVDGPDSTSNTFSSGLPSFASQPSNHFVGQYSFNSGKLQKAPQTQSSTSIVSTLNDQSNKPNSQNSPDSVRPTVDFGSSFQDSKSTVNEQYSFSTQKPIFNQYNHQEGSDNSYYYNTPSKQFNTPAARPQGSIFPIASFDQPNKQTQTPFGSRPQTSDTPTTFFSPQSNTPIDATRYTKPSSSAPVSPTLSTQQDEQDGNAFQKQFNKVIQGPTSSIASPAPTTPTHGNQFSQFGTRPVKSMEQQQQYNGEIYEYNKPPQTLSTPQNGPISGTSDQSSQFGGSSSSTSPVSKSQTDGTYEPSTQFGLKLPQQPFNQGSHDGQDNQEYKVNTPSQSPLRPGQFSTQPSKPSHTSQPIQGASKFPPTYNQQSPSCCNQFTSPSQSTPSGEQDATPQFSNQFKPNEDLSQNGAAQDVKPAQTVSTFAGVGESFGGPRKPPSFDSNGYHY